MSIAKILFLEALSSLVGYIGYKLLSVNTSPLNAEFGAYELTMALLVGPLLGIEDPGKVRNREWRYREMFLAVPILVSLREVSWNL